jgi:hypothetical protein
VRVNEAGHDHRAAGIQFRLVGIFCAQVGGFANRNNLLPVNKHRAIFDNAERAQGAPALGTASQGKQLGS